MKRKRIGDTSKHNTGYQKVKENHCNFLGKPPLAAGPTTLIADNVGDLQIQFVGAWPMNRSRLFVLSLLLFSQDCFGETTAGDSETLQALPRRATRSSESGMRPCL